MFRCAWCRKHGATRRVEGASDETEEVFRYFCNNIHQANWETCQAPPADALSRVTKNSRFEDIVRAMRSHGWMMINCCRTADEKWHITLQGIANNGGTLERWRTHAEHAHLNVCAFSALQNAIAETKSAGATASKSKPKGSVLSPEQYEKLGTTLLRNMAARFEYERQSVEEPDL